MSTPEPRSSAPLAAVPASPSPQWGGAAPSAPDPAIVAAIANALFQAPPVPAAGGAPDFDAAGAVPTLAATAPSYAAAQAAEPPYAPVSPDVVASPGLPSASPPASAPNLGAPAAARVFAPSAPAVPSIPSAASNPAPFVPATSPSGYGGATQFAPSEADLAAIPAALGDDAQFVRPEHGGAGFSPDAHAAAPDAYSFLAPRRAGAGDPFGVEPEATPTGLHFAPPRQPAAATEPARAVPAGGATRLEPAAAAAPTLGVRPFDAASLRRDFPILRQYVHGRPLIWLDNAATTQKPQAVIDRLSTFYENENSNIHRGAHALAARATDAYEAAREKTRRFINAPSARDIIFVRGTTEGINLVAQAFGRRNLREGDEILITWLEHHANIVPWQMLCAETGATLKVAPVDDRGQVKLDEYEKLLSRRTRIVSFTMVANAIGTVTPAKEMIEMAKRLGACVVADAAQAVSHMPVDVQALGCDFLIFSGHKAFGPTGIGVVYGRESVLDAMPPWQGGGNMIVDVTFEKTIHQPPPGRFEAGTGNIADAVGLGAAFDYLETVGMANIAAHEHELIAYATEKLSAINGLRFIGCAAERAGALSFTLDGLRSEDVGRALDREGIAVRSGHHCAQPILRRLGVETSVRPSFALYNTFDDIDALAAAVKRISVEERFRAG